MAQQCEFGSQDRQHNTGIVHVDKDIEPSLAQREAVHGLATREQAGVWWIPAKDRMVLQVADRPGMAVRGRVHFEDEAVFLPVAFNQEVLQCFHKLQFGRGDVHGIRPRPWWRLGRCRTLRSDQRTCTLHSAGALSKSFWRLSGSDQSIPLRAMRTWSPAVSGFCSAFQSGTATCLLSSIGFSLSASCRQLPRMVHALYHVCIDGVLA